MPPVLDTVVSLVPAPPALGHPRGRAAQPAANERAALSPPVAGASAGPPGHGPDRDWARHVASTLHRDVGASIALAQIAVSRLAPDGEASHHLREAAASLRALLAELDGRVTVARPLGERFVGQLQRLQAGPTLQVQLDPALSSRTWPADVEQAVIDVAGEAVANALQHANARRIEASLRLLDGRLRLAVVDDGRGIPDECLRGCPDHLGIAGMHDSAARCGARLDVARRGPRGTHIVLEWPAQDNGPSLPR